MNEQLHRDQGEDASKIDPGSLDNGVLMEPRRDQTEDSDSSTEENSIGYLEMLYGIFFSPASTLRYAARKKPYLWSVLTILAITLFTSLMSLASTLSLNGQVNFGEFSPYLAEFSNNIGYALTIVALLTVPVCWFLQSAVLHLLAEFFGGKGDGKGLFVALGFTTIPFVLSAILSFLIRNIDLPGTFAFLVQLAACVWVMILYVIAIRENYELNTGQAVAVLFLPLVALIAWILIVFLSIGSAFISLG